MCIVGGSGGGGAVVRAFGSLTILIQILKLKKILPQIFHGEQIKIYREKRNWTKRDKIKGNWCNI